MLQRRAEAFNAVIGEELLLRGVLLPRMKGVFVLIVVLTLVVK